MFNFHSKKAEEEEEDYLQFKPYRTFFSKIYRVTTTTTKKGR